MRNSVFAFASLIFSAFVSFSAFAETTEYGSLVHHSELPEVLFLLGQINEGDSFELRRAMRNQEIKLVVTASPGGNLYEGLQIASILNDKGVSTYIPENASCESSCAKVFLGGRKRMVLGKIGVHQFYPGGEFAESNVRNDIATSATQYTTSEVIGILNEFETPPFVYEKMFGTDDIYYFRGIEKQRLNRGGDDEQFLTLMSEIDKLVSMKPSVLQRPTEPPTSLQTAKRPSTPAIPKTTKPDDDLPERFFDLDFFGMDLSSSGIRGISFSSCETYCRNNPACAAYSYVTETRWCWPKSGVENVSVAKGVISGVVDYSRVNPSALERPFRETTAMDIQGYDLYPKGIKNMSLEQCRHACLALNGCVAFSWVAKQSWCFPKYGVGPFSKSWGIISGIKE